MHVKAPAQRAADNAENMIVKIKDLQQRLRISQQQTQEAQQLVVQYQRQQRAVMYDV